MTANSKIFCGECREMKKTCEHIQDEPIQQVAENLQYMGQMVGQAANYERQVIADMLKDLRTTLDKIANTNVYALDPAWLRRKLKEGIETIDYINGKKGN